MGSKIASDVLREGISGGCAAAVCSNLLVGSWAEPDICYSTVQIT